ncbi:GSCFA domain-containing protein [Shewanella baltica]|uniref:GSCFA domain-containing protein n=1 Tax=Shewanella baltica TaxID=62322 RepID=UPI0028714ED6|nr:GSCFA domain-containing protein [Shewanella baltica]MDR9768428.1 GSCFA domain-containing protein [Shewanella baltica]
MNTQFLTPYNEQAEQYFWKTGVAKIDLGKVPFQSIHNLLISKDNSSISSVGSCFAQHVGKWMIENNYPFNRSKLDSRQISSFAFGNVYTPRCFLQWLTLDPAHSHRFDIFYDKNAERYIDLLRPNVHPDGFSSEEALRKARISAKNELFDTLTATNVLIFTLGLTEAWKDIDDVFYPSCPGVIAGEFNDEVFTFHQFNYNEIKSDLLLIKDIIQGINPKIKVILTVSPVPLTATASDKHILVASQYSKSVLRAVAGYIADNDEVFEYFPSFEIITVNNVNDFRFNENRRTVSHQAVEYVMSHFKSAFSDNEITQAQNNSEKNHQETVCDEERLDALNKLSHDSNDTTVSQLTLLGDSHMGKLAKALKEMEIPFMGGMVMNGSGFAQGQFSICETEYFVPLENAASRQLFAPILKNLKAHEQSKFEKKSVIISNIGLQTHQTVARFFTWLQKQEDTDIKDITLKNYVDFFHEDQSKQLSILLTMKERGHTVIVVSDPPFCRYVKESQSMAWLVYSYFDALEYICSQLNILFFNAAKAFDEEIDTPMAYASDICYPDGQHDWIHGNSMYYTWLANKLVPIVSENT